MIPTRPDTPWGLWGTSRILLLFAVALFDRSDRRAPPNRDRLSGVYASAAVAGGQTEVHASHHQRWSVSGLRRGYPARPPGLHVVCHAGRPQSLSRVYLPRVQAQPERPGQPELQLHPGPDGGRPGLSVGCDQQRGESVRPDDERCTATFTTPTIQARSAARRSRSSPRTATGISGSATRTAVSRLDRGLGTFTHYRNDSEGGFVGRITQVIDDRHADIRFTGERGLFHVNEADQTNHPLSGGRQRPQRRERGPRRSGRPVVAGQFAGRGAREVRPRTERMTSYPLPARAGGALASTTAGARSTKSLQLMGKTDYGCRRARVCPISTAARNASRTGSGTRTSNPHSLTATPFSRSIRTGGVLWVGTESSGQYPRLPAATVRDITCTGRPIPAASHPAG